VTKLASAAESILALWRSRVRWSAVRDGELMKPTMQWVALGRQTYRVTWQGVPWTLEATPIDKYPWRLLNGAGVTREIGTREVVGAQAMAEFWLNVTGWAVLPRQLPDRTAM